MITSPTPSFCSVIKHYESFRAGCSEKTKTCSEKTKGEYKRSEVISFPKPSVYFKRNNIQYPEN